MCFNDNTDSGHSTGLDDGSRCISMSNTHVIMTHHIAWQMRSANDLDRSSRSLQLVIFISLVYTEQKSNMPCGWMDTVADSGLLTPSSRDRWEMQEHIQLVWKTTQQRHRTLAQSSSVGASRHCRAHTVQFQRSQTWMPHNVPVLSVTETSGLHYCRRTVRGHTTSQLPAAMHMHRWTNRPETTNNDTTYSPPSMPCCDTQ